MLQTKLVEEPLSPFRRAWTAQRPEDPPWEEKQEELARSLNTRGKGLLAIVEDEDQVEED